VVLNAGLDELGAADLLILNAVLEYGRQARPNVSLTLKIRFLLVEFRHEVITAV
jgi:hypothetical protein